MSISSSRVLLVIALLGFLIGRPARSQIYLGNYTGHTISGKMITVTAGNASVRIIFYAPDILRVDFVPDQTAVFDSSLVVVRDTSGNTQFSVSVSDSTIELSSSALRLVCTKNPVRLSYYSGTGRGVLSEPRAGGLAIGPPFP